MTKRTTLNKVLISCGFVLLAAALLSSAPGKVGFSELPDGRGGINVEAAVYTPEMGFDKARSLAAFKETLYPLLRQNCSGCHSTENKLGSGAQAPVHADVDVNLAHEYALTRVNFREPQSLSSSFVWPSTATIASRKIAALQRKRCWKLSPLGATELPT